MPATLGHVKLPVSDLAASREFYDAALAPLGFELVYDGPSSLGWGPPPIEFFAVELSGEPIRGAHIAFNPVVPASVDAFHAAGLGAGGTDNGAPALRPYGENYYAAFLLDPDGHNIEAVHHAS
jgi:catechol 2,3-dioxygenase-like lactoylglutathione lyase family enzyme